MVYVTSAQISLAGTQLILITRKLTNAVEEMECLCLHTGRQGRTVAVLFMRDDGAWELSGGSEGGGKWLEPRYILKLDQEDLLMPSIIPQSLRPLLTILSSIIYVVSL